MILISVLHIDNKQNLLTSVEIVINLFVFDIALSHLTLVFYAIENILTFKNILLCTFPS